MDYNEFTSRLQKIKNVMWDIPNWLVLEDAGITRDEYHNDMFVISCCEDPNKMMRANMKKLNVLYNKYTKIKYGS